MLRVFGLVQVLPIVTSVVVYKQKDQAEKLTLKIQTAAICIFFDGLWQFFWRVLWKFLATVSVATSITENLPALVTVARVSAAIQLLF